ncbi:MAG: NAD(P)-dependent oxidoreductase [Solirubrobacterales bacterium]
MVTGGRGYIGRHLVTLLASEGTQVLSYNRDYTEHDEPGVTTVQGELYEIPRMIELCREHDVDRIIHTAGLSHPDLSIKLPLTTITANIEGTLSVLETARVAGVPRFVNFSSECAYGHVDGPVTEDVPLDPITPYGVTKATGEMLGRNYTDLHDMEVVSLRVTEVYGPENPMPELMRDMLRAAIDGEPYRLEAGADHRIRFVHVKDVALAAKLAATVDWPLARAYNIRGDREVVVSELVEMVRELFPGAQIEIGPGHLHLDRQGPWEMNLAEADLGYKPKHPLSEGVREYADWLRERPY